MAAEAAAAELSDRLARALSAQQSRDYLTARLAEQTQARDAARAEIARARGELAALRREARCDSDDALPAVEERSARRQKLEKERSDLNATLLKLSAGSPSNRSSPRPSNSTPRASPLASRRLDERIAALERERATVNQTIGEERTLLSQMNGSSRAADAGQDAEDLRAGSRPTSTSTPASASPPPSSAPGSSAHRNKSQGPVLSRPPPFSVAHPRLLRRPDGRLRRP